MLGLKPTFFMFTNIPSFLISIFRFSPAAKIENNDLKMSEKNSRDFRDIRGFGVFDLANVNTNLIFI